jgi:hypothetical protein
MKALRRALALAVICLLTQAASAQPNTATWKAFDGWVVTLTDNVCVVKKLLKKSLPSLGFDQMTFGFAYNPIDDMFAYDSLGLYFKPNVSGPPDAIVYSDGKVLAELGTARKPDETDLDSKRGAYHASTEIAILPYGEVDRVLSGLENSSVLTVFLSSGRYATTINQFHGTRLQFIECMKQQVLMRPGILAPAQR